MKPFSQVLEVWGDFACFSQPALSVERFSYPIMTPSAARNLFDAIYLKPTKFRWQVTKIEVLKRIQYIALRRNEVKNKAPSSDVILRWMVAKEEPEALFADGDTDSLGTDAKGRTQRQTMALKEVGYRIHAEIRPWKEFRNDLPEFESQFKRRAERGQCAWQPYLGCREFPAYFELTSDSELSQAAPVNLRVGWMLYDTFDLSRPGKNTDSPFISLFEAEIKQGVMQIPEFNSPEVKKPRAMGGSDLD